MRARTQIPGAAIAAGVALALLAAPTAAKTIITNEADCKIKIKLQLEFYGDGKSDSIVNVWKADIVSKWSGLKDKSGWCDVVVEVDTKTRAATDPATAGYDQINVKQSPDGSHISSTGEGAIGTDRACEWDDHDSGSVAAHECGHLMGLDNGCEEGYEEVVANDDNTKRKTEPKKGREKSIMGQATCDQKGIQWDIEKILEKAGIACPDSCCRGKGTTTTSGGSGTSTPPPEKPKEPGTASFTESPSGHSCDVIVPDAMGGGLVTVTDFVGNCTVDWNRALDPEADCMADSNLVPIAIRDLQYTAPTFQLPSGDWTGPNTITLRPEPRTPWESTGRMNWATGQFEMVLATQVVNDLFPPTLPLPCVGVLGGVYDRFTGHAQYQSMLWMLSDTATDLEGLLRDGLHGTGLGLLVAPSPARHRALVAFRLPGQGVARLDVYDVRGRLVRRLEGRPLGAGLHFATWDLRDGDGLEVPTGVYLYRLTHGTAVVTTKTVVLR